MIGLFSILAQALPPLPYDHETQLIGKALGHSKRLPKVVTSDEQCGFDLEYLPWIHSVRSFRRMRGILFTKSSVFSNLFQRSISARYFGASEAHWTKVSRDQMRYESIYLD